MNVRAEYRLLGDEHFNTVIAAPGQTFPELVAMLERRWPGVEVREPQDQVACKNAVPVVKVDGPPSATGETPEEGPAACSMPLEARVAALEAAVASVLRGQSVDRARLAELDELTELLAAAGITAP